MKLSTFSVFILILLSYKLNAQTDNFVSERSNNGDLYTFNASSCTLNLISSSGLGFGFSDIAFTSNGLLWGISLGKLYLIDKITGVSTLIGNCGLQGNALEGLNDTTLLTEYDLNLYSINTNTLSTTLIGSIGYKASGDLTWYDNSLYMTTSNQLIKIILDSTNSTIISASAVNDLNHPIPTCNALLTIANPGFNNEIIGFSGSDAFSLCPIDGSFTTLCSTITTTSITGGAAMRLPIQANPPATCDLLNATKTVIENNIFVSPNPASLGENIHIVLGNNNQLTSLKILDITGKEIAQIYKDSNVNSIDINLNSILNSGGSYIIQTYSKNKIIDSRLLIVTN